MTNEKKKSMVKKVDTNKIFL